MEEPKASQRTTAAFNISWLLHEVVVREGSSSEKSGELDREWEQRKALHSSSAMLGRVL